MIFTKSDKSFERAANDDSERLALLKKLQRRRNFGFRGAIVGFLTIIPLSFAISGTYSLETSGWLLIAIRYVTIASVGLLGGSILLNQDIKMLILSSQERCRSDTQPAEQE